MLNRNLSKALIGIVLIVLFADPSWASIWHVAKDDSGEFQIIQDAVDAATAGDTIQIGPGRYTEYTIDDSRELAWYVLCQDKGLTFFGSTEGETIIGHTEPPLVYRYTMFGIGSAPGSQASEYHNITFEVIRGQGISTEWGSLIVEDCKFINSHYGILAIAPYGGLVRNCTFENIGSCGILFYTPSNGVLIENCNLVDAESGIACHWVCEDINIINCTVVGGLAAYSFINGPSGSVRNCTATGQERYGFLFDHTGTVLVDNCRVTLDHERGIAYGLGLVTVPGDISVRRSEFIASGTNTIMAIQTPGFTIDIKDNHFIRASEEAFFVTGLLRPGYTGPLAHVDLSGNYWGTTDTDVIDSGIVDLYGVEDPNYVIDYLPLLTGPVPTKRTTMGGAKALFR